MPAMVRYLNHWATGAPMFRMKDITDCPVIWKLCNEGISQQMIAEKNDSPQGTVNNILKDYSTKQNVNKLGCALFPPEFQREEEKKDELRRDLKIRIRWYRVRTRDKASHDPMPIPLGYRGHYGHWLVARVLRVPVLVPLKTLRVEGPYARKIC
ncbi:hypothetical protein TNCV_4874561 [Trichonephila clavipes]|nr:hypothetical protein TNCV_4874561 [Trichonephila clavipes]